jgi:hypothetical protein
MQSSSYVLTELSPSKGGHPPEGCELILDGLTLLGEVDEDRTFVYIPWSEKIQLPRSGYVEHQRNPAARPTSR